MLPLPTRAKPYAGISLLPDLLVLLLPMIVFTVIGRTVEISALEEATPYIPEPAGPRYGPFGLDNLSAGTALGKRRVCVCCILFSQLCVQSPSFCSILHTCRRFQFTAASSRRLGLGFRYRVSSQQDCC